MNACVPTRKGLNKVCLPATTPFAVEILKCLTILAVAALSLIASATTAKALCPSGYQCETEQVVVQTAAPKGANYPACDTPNDGGNLRFGPIAKNNGQKSMRACLCAFNANFPVDQTGVNIISVKLVGTNTKDFTIEDSGFITNGQQDTSGCNGRTLTTTAGCPGNPAQYCYLDIKFAPSEYGTPLTSNLNSVLECPGEPGNSACFDHCWGVCDLADYGALPVGLEGTGSGFGITSPAHRAAFSLSAPVSTSDPGTAPVTYQAQATSDTTTKWQATLRYQPSGKGKNFTTPLTVKPTSGSTPEAIPYTGQGGFLGVQATADFASVDSSATITGWAADPTVSCTISQELRSLYTTIAPAGSTNPQLLERIAYSESQYNSNYGQFVPMYLRQPPAKAKTSIAAVYGLWPHENSPNPKEGVKRGDYIGLMQVKNSADRAWNWVANASEGKAQFQDSIRIAGKHQSKIDKQDNIPTPLLTPTQLEQLALGNYKGFQDPTWYWAPRCSSAPAPSCPYNARAGNCLGGSWSWIQNPCPCTKNRAANDPSEPKCQSELNVIVQVDKIIGATATAAPCE